jgi:membrane-associated phospholipid phosphatase
MLEVKPTLFDALVINFICSHVNSTVEEDIGVATYLADGHLVGLAALTYWLASRRKNEAQKAEAHELALGVGVSLLIPHIVKHFVNQIRPDRTLVGPRHGIPRSGSPYDAFPSGHAVHLGAVASALSRHHPAYKAPIWTAAFAIVSTRIVLLAHWPSDVAAGLAIGKGVDFIVSKICGKRR